LLYLNLLPTCTEVILVNPATQPSLVILSLAILLSPAIQPSLVILSPAILLSLVIPLRECHLQECLQQE